MEFLAQLWLPIIVSAVGVFVASSLIHMVIKWHNFHAHAAPGGTPDILPCLLR